MAESYTKIPNDMFEAMYSAELSRAQYKALLFIIRKTIGWGKRADAISIGQIAVETKQSRQAAIDAVKGLEDAGIISVERRPGYVSKIKLEPVKKWILVKKSIPVRNSIRVPVQKSIPVPVKNSGRVPVKNSIPLPVRKSRPTKENIYISNTVANKDNNNPSVFAPEGDADYLFGKPVYTEAEIEELRKEGYEI